MLRLLVILCSLCATSALAAPKPGAPAPDFVGLTSSGEEIRLSQLRGRKVILEWTNHGCPFVQKHYDTGNMQALQKEMTDKGVAWLSIISSAPGKQGHVSPAEADALTQDRNAAPDHVLLDPAGKIGRLYKAKTTPHMFLIDEHGMVVYMGAIDNKSSANPKSVKTAQNHIRAAMADLEANRPVAVDRTRPYGCSVKY